MSNGEALYSDFWQRLAHPSRPQPRPHLSVPKPRKPSPFFVLFWFLIFFTHKTFHLHLQTRLNNGLKPGLSLKPPSPFYSSTPLLSLKVILNQIPPSSHPPLLPCPRPPKTARCPKEDTGVRGPILIRCSTLSFRPSWCGHPLRWWWLCLRPPRHPLLWLRVWSRYLRRRGWRTVSRTG